MLPGSPGSRARSFRTCRGLRLRGAGPRLAITPEAVWPSRSIDTVGTPMGLFSELNGRPARTPVNASPRTSRSAAHDSGTERRATPYSVQLLHLRLLAGFRRFPIDHSRFPIPRSPFHRINPTQVSSMPSGSTTSRSRRARPPREFASRESSCAWADELLQDAATRANQHLALRISLSAIRSL